MIVLSPRLKTAADMVRKGVVAADIGTDHAYLPSYLVLSGICPRALACDLRKGPLENAAETLEHWNIADKITLRLSDGLDELSAGEADDIIMAGMGGILIAKPPWQNQSERPNPGCYEPKNSAGAASAG